MIRFRIKELLAEKEFREQRKITLGEVSEKTGVNRTSLSKMQSPIMRHSTTTNAIDSLCKYFRCQVGDLMVYIDDDQIESQNDQSSE
ncbi:helix-turn-helix domain-containing protein [Tolumonas lignilytica]|uniref:helix-turn-helix domain-containing protein n=1 Tax=Tolumonas lignilytica TaxID=1283284 RepID=UPI000465E8C5|nr:helix-turn-helix transcriptional regulator [Tolumonas lignilytica]